MTISKSRFIKGFIICFLILFLCALLYGCGSVESDNNDSSNEEVVEFSYMNENLIKDEAYYNVYEATIEKSIPTTLGTEITTKHYFMYIKINITNNSHETKNFYLSDYTLISPSGKIYEPRDYIFLINRMHDEELGAGFSEDYYMVFEIPYVENDGDYKLVINLNFWLWEEDPYIILNDLQNVYQVNTGEING